MRSISLLLIALMIACLCLSCKEATKPEETLTLLISPTSGAYTSAQTIVISCNYADAFIRYSTDGSDPGINSLTYTQPLLMEAIVSQTSNYAQLKAKAFREGSSSSETISREYHISYVNTIATPLISPEGGDFDAECQVSISCATPGAVIRYTINGIDPTPNSALYQQPLSLTHSGRQRIKARAFLQNWNPSPIGYNEYYINHPVQEMKFVEGGTFDNGSSEIQLSSFYMDTHEVIQGEYFDVMGADPDYVEISKDLYPVYYVSWFDAIEYCNKRSLLDHLSPCYSYLNLGVNPTNWTSGWNSSGANHTNISCNWQANGYRLPTEMEWMFAARGGNLSQEYQYSGSDSVYVVAWYAGNSGYSVHRVGTKTANELGIYDLSGNLWEWCWDIFAPYPAGNQSNPHGSASGNMRVLRGGAWNSDAALCRIEERNKELPAQNLAASIGFRCVKKAP